MKIPVKMLKSGFSMPVYGLGTWEMGGRHQPDHADDEKNVAAIRAAIEKGITHIDTAAMYGGGHAEELVGEAIKDFPREELLIATKIIPADQSFEGVMRSFEKSLNRLDVDYVDLYLIHAYPLPGMPVSETLRAMDRLVEAGVVKNIGVCNFTINRFEEAQKHTANKLVCNQLHYSLRVREAEKYGLVEYCQQKDVFLSAWGPLEKGMLESGGVLNEMADKYDKTPYQVALNWLIAQPNVVTIPKTSSVKHLEENLGALGWELDPADTARLSKEFPGQITESERAPLDYEGDIPA